MFVTAGERFLCLYIQFTDSKKLNKWVYYLQLLKKIWVLFSCVTYIWLFFRIDCYIDNKKHHPCMVKIFIHYVNLFEIFLKICRTIYFKSMFKLKNYQDEILDNFEICNLASFFNPLLGSWQNSVNFTITVILLNIQ